MLVGEHLLQMEQDLSADPKGTPSRAGIIRIASSALQNCSQGMSPKFFLRLQFQMTSPPVQPLI